MAVKISFTPVGALLLLTLSTVASAAEIQPDVKIPDPPGTVTASDIKMPQIPGATGRPVAAIYCDCEGVSPGCPGGLRRGVSAIVIIWADGTILWSKNHISGGPPYFKGRVSREIVSDALKRVQNPEAGIESFCLQFYPGGCLIYIAVDTVSKAFYTLSRHGLDEETSTRIEGTVLTPEEKRQQAADESALRQFRENWGRTKETLLSVIPEQGQRICQVHFELLGPGVTKVPDAPSFVSQCWRTNRRIRLWRILHGRGWRNEADGDRKAN